jgi:hypothetical protein
MILATLLLLVPISQAQEATGRITGTVSDPSGAVIPGAQLTVTNTASQVNRKTTTDHDGYYQVLSLPIGTYTVTAEHNGFRTVVIDQNRLAINQALRVDIRLQVGATNQTIEVGAETATRGNGQPNLGAVCDRTRTDRHAPQRARHARSRLASARRDRKQR